MKKNKVLVLTSKDDPHADIIIDKFNKWDLGKQIIRLNTSEFAENCIMEFDGKQAKINIIDSERTFNTNEILSVWYRRPDNVKIQTNDDEFVIKFIERESNTFLNGLYHITHDSAIWINPLPALEKSRQKLYQIYLAQKLKIPTPKTLITNNPEKVLDFFDTTKSKIINKGLSKPWFYYQEELYPYFTRIVEREEILANSDSIKRCTTLFQQFIDKSFDLRVIIFGNKVFAFEIHSQTNEFSKIDVRGASPELLEHKVHKLPKKLEDKLLLFCKIQNLIFSAIDLVYDKNGNYYFLENNSNGQWLWLEFLTGFDLSSEFRKLLLNEN